MNMPRASITTPSLHTPAMGAMAPKAKRARTAARGHPRQRLVLLVARRPRSSPALLALVSKCVIKFGRPTHGHARYSLT